MAVDALPVGVPQPDPYRCPDCGTVLVDVGGIARCPRCGFAADDPHAGALWRLDTTGARLRGERARAIAELERIDGELDRLVLERAHLIVRMRRERAERERTGFAGAPAAVRPEADAAVTGGPALPAPERHRLPAQVLLVGLGALLLVVAGVVFAAVTWERLGAVGQASVLAGATALAAALTLLAARARLSSTAEALALVTAGFALVDVHGVRLAVGPAGDPRLVWAVGLSVVAAGLVLLGRSGRLTAPGLVAVLAAQPPLVLVATILAGEAPLVAAAALLVLALTDRALARRVLARAVPGLPPVAAAVLRVLGSVAWMAAWTVSIGAATAPAGAAVTTAERTWGLVLLAVATGELVVLTLATVRVSRGRAEGYAAVVAGNAVLAVHGIQLLAIPDAGGEVAWAVGLTVAAAGLVVLGRAAGLRGPFVAAAVLAQLPVPMLASVADRALPTASGPAGAGPALASAILAVAWLDVVLSARVLGSRTPWAPPSAVRVLRVLAVAAWLAGASLALPWAFGLADPDAPGVSRWWGIAVLALASTEAAMLSRARPPASPLSRIAAAAAVVVGLVVVAAATVGLGVPTVLAALVPSVAALGVAAFGRSPRTPGGGGDARVRAGRYAALGWVTATILPWAPVAVASVLAPAVALAVEGWWSQEPSVGSGLPGLAGLRAGPADDPATGAAALAAVVIAVAAVRTAVAVLPGVSARWGATASTAAAILGAHVLVAVAALRWDVPLTLVTGAYVVGAGALVSRAVRERRVLRPWFAAAAAPFAASALLWAGLVDVVTVAALLGVVLLAGVVVARGLIANARLTTTVATTVGGSALGSAAMTGALVVGLVPAHALVVAVAVGAACSGLAVVADARAAWWAPAVELTAAAVAVVGLAALAGGRWDGPLSLALAILAVVSAAHVLRPRRREVAAWTSALLAVVLLWLRLGVAQVHVVEPYTLPAAALLLVAGGRQMRRSAVGSWPALGPGLLVAAAPSVFVAVTGDSVLRPLLVLGVAVAASLLGARRRLRSPLVVGVVSSAVVAIDQIFPVVARFPRWVTLAAAGVLLLGVGATFERRKRQARQLVDTYGELR